MSAYAILKRQDHAPSGLKRMRLVDYQSIDSDDALGPIIAAAIARCRRERIHTLEHVGCGLPKMRTFDALAPYRRKLPAWPYYFKAADPGWRASWPTHSDGMRHRMTGTQACRSIGDASSGKAEIRVAAGFINLQIRSIHSALRFDRILVVRGKPVELEHRGLGDRQ